MFKPTTRILFSSALAALVAITAACSRDSSAGKRAAATLPEDFWTSANTQTVRIEEGRLTPSILQLMSGQPTRLVLVNSGDAPDAFVAPEFFQAVQIGHVRDMDGMIERPETMEQIRVQPDETLEFFFVPELPGRYALSAGESEGEIVVGTWY